VEKLAKAKTHFIMKLEFYGCSSSSTVAEPLTHQPMV
jgi:hypothetical protein